MFKIFSLLVLIFYGAIGHTQAPGEQAPINSSEVSPASADTNGQLEKKGLKLYNFKTKNMEKIENPMELTEEKALEYLPPLEVAIKIFDRHMEKEGTLPIEAVLYTTVDLTTL